jgi:hydroxymethylglutaryl-CoA lyase
MGLVRAEIRKLKTLRTTWIILLVGVALVSIGTDLPELANAVAALGAGVRSFESSFGELGGCPVPKGATGNIASEDLVSMLHEMGYETGIDLEKLVACAREAQRVLGRPLGSHVLTAGPVEWHRG